MKPKSTSTSRKPRKRTRNGATLPHQNRKKFRTQPSARKVMLTLFWDKRGVILEHYMPSGNTVTSTTCADLLKNHLHPAIKFKRRGHLITGVLLQHDDDWPQTGRSTVATIQVSPSIVFHIRRTAQTSPPVTFMSLDRSKRRLDASLSGPTKRCSRRCTSGCALNQKIFFF
jgi:hypothetical protein